MKNKAVLTSLLLLLIPGIAAAHQPRIVHGTQITVEDPEVSKAYYGQLAGEPHTYHISSDTRFTLYAGLLVPDREGQQKDVSAVIVPSQQENAPIAFLDGLNFEWKPLYEEFGADHYFLGPEFQKVVAPGSYDIRVGSKDMNSRYVLVIGETETFPLLETLNAMTTIPTLKHDFFGSSPLTFLLTPFGVGYLIILLLLGFVAGFAYRAILKKTAKSKIRKRSRNIGKGDRIFRTILGAALLGIGIWTWNPLMLFFAGFCFFEAIFSWCGFYAAIGKNSCPIDER